MSEQNHTLLDHVAELALLAYAAFLGYVLVGAVLQSGRPKPSLLSAEQIERNRAEAEERWRDEQAQQRKLLALEIAEQLREPDVARDDDMLRIQNARG